MRLISAKLYLRIVLVFTVLYGLTIFSDYSFMNNYLSVIPVLLTGIGLLVYIPNDNHYKGCWNGLAFGAFSWASGDILWLVYENFLGIDPEESYFIMFLYLLTNIGFLCAAFIYFLKNMKKWHKLQLVVDSIVVVLMVGLTLMDSLVLKVDFLSYAIIEHIFYLLYGVTDAIMLSILLIMITSARVQKIMMAMKWVATGLLIYIFADLSYIYMHYLDYYIPNSWIDWVYVASMTCFVIGALSPEYLHEERDGNRFSDQPQNMGKSFRMLVLVLIPVGMYGFGMVTLLTVFHIMLIILLHQVLSSYIQIAIKNEQLLHQERTMKSNLEALVEHRTEQLIAANSSLEELAIKDALTHMYNRRFFIEKLDVLIESGNFDFSVYFMDLDHFKIINDLHGHDMGDKVLNTIAQRFINWQSVDQWISRIGGDEFAIIQVHRTSFDKQSATLFCKALLDLFAEPVIIDQYRFNVGVSVGISRFPYDSLEREHLVKYADLAMYQAKKNHQDQKCVFYSAYHGAHIERKGKIEMLLKTINFDDAFSLHFQPQFSLPTRTLIGIEALLRWHHPEMGFISPGEFIPVAEESDAILDVGKWVIHKAFRFIKEWNENNPSPVKIGINLSPLQFDSIDFFPYIQQQLEACGVLAEWIDFEITETSAMNSSTLMEEVFTALAGLGVQISVDDFGTGYSSLSYIRRFDIDQLKIAKELVDPIGNHQDERLIIRAIIMMAKGMGLKTIAEGVETIEQMTILQELGCDAIQGYYLSRPLPADVLYERYHFRSM